MVELTNITNFVNETATAATINANSNRVENEFEKVVYRDGSKAVTGNIDFNGKRILNLGAPVNATDVVRMQDLDGATFDSIPLIPIISDIATLRAYDYTSVTNNTVVLVMGYYLPGSGGGQFYWNASSTATDDAGLVINPTGNPGAGRWLRLFDSHNIFLSWFGSKDEAGFDNGPALRAARLAARNLGGIYAGRVVVAGFGTFEVRSEADSEAGVRWQEGGGLVGGGYFGTIFHWYTARVNQPLFLAQPDPELPQPIWGVRFEDFTIEAFKGTQPGSGVTISPQFNAAGTAASASLGFNISGVRVKGCRDGISILVDITAPRGVTSYGGVVQNNSVEGIVNLGRGFYSDGAAYCHWINNESYTAVGSFTPPLEVSDLPLPGETAYAFFIQATDSKGLNNRAVGAVYLDMPDSDFDITLEGQSSTCAHNGDAAVRVNRMRKISLKASGARIAGASGPRYALSLQDTDTTIESLVVSDIDTTYGSPITPLQVSGGRCILIAAEASGTGVLKPEDDVAVAFDPTFGGNLRIIEARTWSNWNSWSAAYNPPSIAAGAVTFVDVSCLGLVRSIPMVASFSLATGGVMLDANYQSNNVARVYLHNVTGAPVDLGAGTLSVRVIQ